VAKDIKQALYEYLTADATVSGLVSTRIYPIGDVPQDAARPYVTYQRISEPREYHQGGEANLRGARFQLNCWADTPDGAETLGTAVADALSAYAGTMGANAQVTVRGAFIDAVSDDIAAPQDATQRGPARAIVEALIWYRTS